MSALVAALVVYAGVIGPHADRVDRQLGSLLHHDAGVDRAELPANAQRSLCGHDARARDVAAGLRQGGVVAGRIIKGKRARRLRVYLYDANGDVRSQVEVALDGDALDKGGLAALRDSLVPDVLALQQPPAAGENDATASDDTADDATASDDTADDTTADDTTADDTTADDTTADDTTADDTTADDTTEMTPPLHMGATVGLGFLSRNFATDMRGIAEYDARAIGTARFTGDIEPTARTRLDVVAESSLGLTTALMGERVPTTVTRWEAQGSWALVTGRVNVGPVIGVGRREFAIASEAPSRSPDGDYLYLVAGGRSALTLGKRVTLTANLRFEPVVGGEQPTSAVHGRASRWAFDVGLGLEVKLRPWLLLRSEAGLQTFSWRFADGGGASDRYVGAMFSLGTRY